MGEWPQEFYLASSSNYESGLGLLGLEMDWIWYLLILFLKQARAACVNIKRYLLRAGKISTIVHVNNL